MTDSVFDSFMRRWLYVQSYATHQANQFDPFLRSSDRAIRDILSRYPEGITTKAELKTVLRQIKGAVDPIYSEWVEDTLADLEEFAGEEVAFDVKALQKGVTFDVDTPEFGSVWLGVLGRPVTTHNTAGFIGDLLDEFSKAEIKRVNNVVVSGYYEGQTVGEITRRIRGTKRNRYTDGILSATSRNARVIARTAVNHVATQARMSTFKKQSIIKRWEFSATLDFRTSDICSGLHGTKWKIGEGPEPPRHYACRSSAIPVIPANLSLFGTRKKAASGADGREVVDSPANYYDWLKTQPVSFQDDRLGKSKAELFRSSGLTTEEFRKLTISKYGDPLTIKEMRAKEPEAFERAGLT